MKQTAKRAWEKFLLPAMPTTLRENPDQINDIRRIYVIGLLAAIQILDPAQSLDESAELINEIESWLGDSPKTWTGDA